MIADIIIIIIIIIERLLTIDNTYYCIGICVCAWYWWLLKNIDNGNSMY